MFYLLKQYLKKKIFKNQKKKLKNEHSKTLNERFSRLLSRL